MFLVFFWPGDGRATDARRSSILQGDVDLIQDPTPSLFRGVMWKVSSAAPTIAVDGSSTRMIIPYQFWQSNFVTQLTATVLFALPGDEAVVVPVRRHCEIVLNLGPNGTLGFFTVLPVAQAVAGTKLRPQTVGASLSPMQQYVVNISGWSHHSMIRYSVWFYWASKPESLFRLSCDSTSSKHVITVPGQVFMALFGWWPPP